MNEHPPVDSENSPLLDDKGTSKRRTRAHSDVDNTIESFLYAVNSFSAVMKPVSLTMLFAAVVVTNVPSPTSSSHTSSYEVFDTSNSQADPTSVRLEKSFVNSLTIVLFLAIATFGIILLYKYKFMKVLVGYMMFSSVVLLGMMGGLLSLTVLQQLELPCDSFVFYFMSYNFAIVGVVSIFYQRGVPVAMTQGYLVLTAVLMAWQLSNFEEWTGWCLLVTLAMYDLCAVLTPCGPLKMLVSLMQEDGAEPMPGLLFEADLPNPAKQETKKSFTQADFGVDNAHDETEISDGGDGERRNTIKLGLGDFVFYSVLVSRAATAGFVPFVSSFLVILIGLGVTLMLLAIYEMALPALPVSIALGTMFYFVAIVFVVPFLEVVAANSIYF
jgi:presenilin 1